jgi:hypothetical protein
MRAFLIALCLLAFIGPGINAQDPCPKPRILITNDISYYNQKSIEEDLIINLLNTAANSIIAQNRNDIAFSSLQVPGGEVDYFLTLGNDFNEDGLQVLIKMVDNNKRLVLNSRSKAYDVLNTENLNSIAHAIAKEISPLINRIKEHQYLIRNTTKAAISSKYALEKRSYSVKVNEKKRITFILKDCDDVVLPGRTIILELEGDGKIDKKTCTVDENGRGEFIYTSPENNGKATVTLAHPYEDVAGNDNRFSVDAVKFNTTGKLWLLVNHISKGAEIYIVGEHIGELEMDWNNENTRGGGIAAFSADPDEEIWSSSLVGFIDWTVTASGEDVWTVSNSWFPGPAKIRSRQQGGYAIEILWPNEDGTSMPVRGTITFEKPELFDQARKKYLAAKRGS